MFDAPNTIDDERRFPAQELLRQAASAYLRRGWSFIPLVGKHPALKRWKEFQRRLPTAEEASAWFADRTHGVTGAGIVTGKLSGLVVVDCDTIEDAAYWRDHFSSSPLAVQTGRGGLHVYYQAPENLNVGNRVKIHRRQIDLRGEGGYVAAPPSMHPSGTRYAWVDQNIDLHQHLPMFDPAWFIDRNELVASPGGIIKLRIIPLQHLGCFRHQRARLSARTPCSRHIERHGGSDLRYHTFAVTNVHLYSQSAESSYV